MSIYAEVDAVADATCEQVLEAAKLVAERCAVTELDALYHLKRTLADRLKTLKLADGVDVDDGRAASWRVRLQVWTGPQLDNMAGDSDPGKHLDADGETVIRGLIQVGQWVRELVTGLHGGLEIGGLGDADIARKVKSLRVALHHQNGSCAWRLRYHVVHPAVDAMTHDEARAQGLNPMKYARSTPRREEECLAQVRITREGVAPRNMRP